jgi:hypothetical protein
MAAIGVLAGAAISYVGQQQTNRANSRAAAQQGYVNTTTNRDPYPGTGAYRDAALQAAFESTFPNAPRGQRPAGWQPDPRTYNGKPIGPAPSYSVGGDPNAAGVPAGYRVNQRGQVVPVKNPGGKGGSGGAGKGNGAASGFNGVSGETNTIRDRMMTDLPAQNAPLYGAGQGYVQDTLEGDSRNPLIGKATGAADAIAEDPRLAQFQDYLMGDLGIGGKSSSVGGSNQPRVVYNVNPNYATAGAGGAQAAPGYGSSTGAAEALKKLIAGELPQGWQGAEDAISRRVSEERASNIRDLRARAVGSGFYGGDVYKELEQGAIAKGDMELADALATARYQAFQNALNEGASYDLGMANIAAGERSASNASGAAAGAASQEIASREKLAKLGTLMDSLGLGEQSRFGRAGALGDLAGLVSTDQRAALGGVGEIAGGRRDDLGSAGTLSLGADRNRVDLLSSGNSLAAARAGVGLGRSQLAFDRERYYDPLSRLGTFTDVMNGLYGGYGSETTSGRDTRSVSPPAFSSPYGAALSGASVGGQIGSQYGRSRTYYQPPGRNETGP